ncbi:biopolymer transporter ExbD [Archangium violaceum]|uniref:ExbD/TolR family protein n=1 Tax=Archangium violaceum TaxID=83451 RepID=UPI00193B1D7A|nr:biopolymer transporter ExbD [Archangium violaceum]QRK08450.1 biopolymer transporter ExbD [Archangium violaceum]
MTHNKTRRSWVRPASAPNSEINVTPLVDVVLVLLIIFMVVTPLMEKDIEVRVPETEVEENPPPDPNDTQIVVRVAGSGDYSINTEKIAAADYVTRLTQMLDTRKQDDRVVFFVADDEASYGKLVAALDGAKAAGAKVLGFAPDKPEGTAPTPPP